jgi:hypothetical protein
MGFFYLFDYKEQTGTSHCIDEEDVRMMLEEKG